MQVQIKIVYKSETKKLRKTTDYSSLKSQAQKAFGDLPPNFKLFYEDSDGDMISISNDDDFEEAIECVKSQNIPTLKLIIEQSVDAARLVFNAQAAQDTFRQSNLNASQS